jgi:hypothetical protein
MHVPFAVRNVPVVDLFGDIDPAAGGRRYEKRVDQSAAGSPCLLLVRGAWMLVVGGVVVAVGVQSAAPATLLSRGVVSVVDQSACASNPVAHPSNNRPRLACSNPTTLLLSCAYCLFHGQSPHRSISYTSNTMCRNHLNLRNTG